MSSPPFTTVIKRRRPLVKLTPEQKAKLQGNPPPAKRRDYTKHDDHPMSLAADPDSIRGAWQELWQSRLNLNDPRGLILDGKPISLDELMILTNTYRKEFGMPQVGKNPKWIV